MLISIVTLVVVLLSISSLVTMGYYKRDIIVSFIIAIVVNFTGLNFVI